MTTLITGTDGADSLTGTADDDIIFGLDGKDRLYGYNGSDWLDGGAGDDRLEGDLADDTLIGGDGNDYLLDPYGSTTAFGGNGDDTIDVAGDRDVVEGGDGNDSVYAHARLSNVVDGGDGDDEIVIAQGDATLTGGLGRDTFRWVSAGRVLITDFAAGDAGDICDLNGVLAQLQTYSGGNPFGTGDVQLVQDGADVLVQADRDGVSGPEDFVTLYVLENVVAGDLVAANFGGYIPDGTATPGLTIDGTSGQDQLTGSVGGDTLHGLDGNDELDGGNGADWLDGGTGNDYLTGGLGDDTLTGGDGNDLIGGGTGNVVAAGNNGDDTINVYGSYAVVYGGDGNDQIWTRCAATLSGGGGRDEFRWYGEGQGVIVDFAGGSGGDFLILDNILQILQDYAGGNPFATGHLRVVQDGVDTLFQMDRDGVSGPLVFTTLYTLQNFMVTALTADNFAGYSPYGDLSPGLELRGSNGPNEIVSGYGNDTIYGLDDNDRLNGRDGADQIDGGSGNDTLEGGLGDDILLGGDGNDVISDGYGGATIAGGSGHDTISASGERADIDGGEGNDVIYLMASLSNIADGGDGDDWFRTGSGDAMLTGGAGWDTYQWSSEGNALITDFTTGDGTDNHDSFDLGILLLNLRNYSGGNPFLSRHLRVIQDGADTLFQMDRDGGSGPIGFTTLYVLKNVVAVSQTAVNFGGYTPIAPLMLIGTEADDTLTGGLDNDLLDGLDGRDLMSGGLGNDTYVVDHVGDVVVELPDGGSDLVRSSVAYLLGANVENLVLTGAAAISGTGNALGNLITGNDAGNTLTGLAGNDVLDGGAGADTLIGGLGSDTYWVDNAGDVVIELAAQGTDTVQSSVRHVLGDNFERLTLTGALNINGTGNGLDNIIVGSSGHNRLDGLAGADTLLGGLGDDTYVIDNAGDKVREFSDEGNDLVVSSVTFDLGSQYVEYLTLTGTNDINATGNALANILNGNAGNNVLNGGAGADKMFGGAGDDTYYVDNALDRTYELSKMLTDTGGHDVVYAGVNVVLDQFVEDLVLTGGFSLSGTGNALDNRITGNSGNNVLRGNDGNDVLDGGTGGDLMAGGLGDDTFYVDSTLDHIVEFNGQGKDTLYSSVTFSLGGQYVETVFLTGTADINITANNIANTLTGNTGRNILDGGAGADVLTGGLGADVFLFGVRSGIDLITDFSAAEGDVINLHACAGGVVNGGGIVLTQVGADTLITLRGGNTVTVAGAVMADVTTHIIW